MPGVKRWIRLALEHATYGSSGELYDLETAPFTVEVRMLKNKVVETLLHGCVTWTLGLENLSGVRKAHHKLLGIIGFQCQQRTNNPILYAKVHKKAQCERVEMANRKRRLLIRGGRAEDEI